MLKTIKILEFYNKNLLDFKDYIEFVDSKAGEKLDLYENEDSRSAVLTEAYIKYSKAYSKDPKVVKMVNTILKMYEGKFEEAYKRVPREFRWQIDEMFVFAFAVSNWCKYKQIYKFDEDTFEMLVDQEPTKNNSCEVLEKLNMPYDTFFIENHCNFISEEHCDTFMVERVVSDYGVTLTIFFLYEKNIDKGYHTTVSVNIPYGSSLEEVVEKNYTDFEKKAIYSVMNLIMYLSQPKIEILKKSSGIKERKTDMPKSFYSVNYDENEVGYSLGNAIRKYRYIYENKEKGEGTGGVKRPHMRCGHFHHYWTGKGREKLIVKYVEPTFVKGGSDKATVHKVK